MSAIDRFARSRGRSAPGGAVLPLATLRARLDAGSAAANWSMDPDGVLGRTLETVAGPPVVFPLRLSGPVQFTARAMLFPHDWRDGRDGVRARVAVLDAGGEMHELWSAPLWASDRGGPRGRQVQVEIPEWATALTLGLRPLRALRVLAVTRSLWVEPAFVDPAGVSAPLGDGGIPEAPAAPDQVAAVAPGPLISVLTPVHNPPLQMLEEAIASVRGQSFTDWELCLVDDGSDDPAVLEALERHAAADGRVHIARRERAGGISDATNAALAMASGRYVALLDHDDVLTPDALSEVAARLTADPGLDMIYSDEDVVADGRQIERHPKPGWSPDHLAVAMYTCHLGVYRRSLAEEIGGFTSRFDGCQDYDFVLRLTELTDRVAHIPKILYHWRAHAASTAGGDAKPYAYLAQPGAIAAHLERSGIDADVQFGHLPGLHRVIHRVDPATRVDLVLAVDAVGGLTAAARSWVGQQHSNFGVSICAPGERLDEVVGALREGGIESERINAVAARDSSRRLADAAKASRADQLLLMQSPAIGLTHDWLSRLLGYALQRGVGVSGPMLLSDDGRIINAGVALPTGLPLHLRYGDHGAAGQALVYNLAAVSGVALIARATYEAVGGLDPDRGELALVDLCLRVGEAGLRTVLVPDSRLRAVGPDQTVNDLPALWALRRAWADRYRRDPYYNASFRTDRGDSTMPRSA